MLQYCSRSRDVLPRCGEGLPRIHSCDVQQIPSLQKPMSDVRPIRRSERFGTTRLGRYKASISHASEAIDSWDQAFCNEKD